MSDRSAFIIPKGVSLEPDSQGICIEFEDDIIIQAPVGMPIKKLHSRSGTIRIEIALDVEEISAPNGSIILLEDTTCTQCTGVSVESQGTLKAQEVTLTGSMQGFSDFSCNTLNIQGSLNIQGDSTIHDIHVDGSARFEGSLITKKSFFGADLHVQGHCSASVLTAQGNIRIHGNIDAESLLSDKSKITCEQEVRLKLLRAKDIILKGKENNITAIQAHDYVSISEGSLNSDVLVAPKVDLHPNTVGKIMIVDVQSPLGPHSIKGCLSPEDIAPLLPNPTLFIQQRGILIDDVKGSNIEEPSKKESDISNEFNEEDKLEEPPESTFEIVSDEEPMSVEKKEDVQDHTESDIDSSKTEDIKQNNEPSNVAPQEEEFESPSVVEKTEQEAIFAQAASENTWQKSFEEELSGIIEEANQKIYEQTEVEPAVEIIEETQENFHEENITPLSEYYAQNDTSEDPEPPLLDAARIVIPSPIDEESDSDIDSDDLEMLPMRNIPTLAESKGNLYDSLKKQTDKIIADYGTEAPSSLIQMRSLIEAEEYPTLRMEIKAIWSQVLRHHQKKNTRIPGLVTMAFNEINKLLN
ncbi:MAG: hypothetical protein CL916_02465 [Deltaproteobacteria bacterium]|nr:hypothetical protein [Deltaproteobacteria bacterium]